MSDLASADLPEVPPARLVASAQAMIPALMQRAAAVDREAKLAPETVRALRDAGFFRILQPQKFGGYAMRPSVLWQVSRQLGRGCGSTAFIVSLLGVHAWIVGMFEQRAQEDVFRNDSDAIVSQLSIGTRRSNEAKTADGGYVVSGAWSYASGIDYADWVIASIRVPDGMGALQERIALVPSADFSIDYESWNVLGARGTGSKDVTLRDAFVPHHRTIAWDDVQQGNYPGMSVNDGPLYKMSAGSLFALSSAAPVIAVATAMVDHFVEEMALSAARRTAKPQVERQWVQILLGRCASQIHMTHAALLHDADEVYDAALAGDELSLETQARHRVDAAMLSRTALAAADELVSALGGRVLASESSIQRAFRDIHAMASHFRVQPEGPCESFGRVLLGLHV